MDLERKIRERQRREKAAAKREAKMQRRAAKRQAKDETNWEAPSGPGRQAEVAGFAQQFEEFTSQARP
jgi:hypothetical protein